MIVTSITITPDRRVLVRRATNNIRPLHFRYGEIESLTELLRSEGRKRFDLEILSLFFQGLWQGDNRYTRAVGYVLFTDKLDKYEAWKRCHEDKEYERHLLLRMWCFLHYRPVPCRCHIEHRGRVVRCISAGRISFCWQRRRIFRSIIDAQAALAAKGWNPEEFQIVQENDRQPQDSE